MARNDIARSIFGSSSFSPASSLGNPTDVWYITSRSMFSVNMPRGSMRYGFFTPRTMACRFPAAYFRTSDARSSSATSATRIPLDVIPAASPMSTFTNTDASTILAVTFLIIASMTCLIRDFMNSSRVSVSVILSTSPKAFSTHPQTRSLTSVAGISDSIGLELLLSPLVPLPNTHSVEPSNLRCHVSPSLAESFLTGVLSTVLPSGSFMATASPFFVYFPDSLTRVNVGTMTSLSPGDMLPESSMVLFLQSEDATRV